MTYREAHTALLKTFPTGTATYAEVKAEATRLAGGYAQGLQLLRGLAQQNVLLYHGTSHVSFSL